jgi:hypothetical protein
MPIDVVAGARPKMTLEEKVEWLMKQVSITMARLDRIEGELEQLPTRWRRDIAKTRQELESMQEALEHRLADAKIRLRLLGLGYVVIGLVLAWVGNVL